MPTEERTTCLVPAKGHACRVCDDPATLCDLDGDADAFYCTAHATGEPVEGEWVVVAWSDMCDAEPTGRYLDRYGFEPELRPVPRALALVWARPGSDQRLDRAAAYVAEVRAEEHVTAAAIYHYPVTETDPLGRAKAAILAEVRS